MLTLPNIIIVSLLSLGYLFMLFAVINQPISTNDSTGSKTYVLRLQREKQDQIAKIKELELKLENAKLQTDLVIKNKLANSKTPQIFENIAYRPGVIVLGMHRSGTSILGGLINKMGLKTGGPLIAPAGNVLKTYRNHICT